MCYLNVIIANDNQCHFIAISACWRREFIFVRLFEDHRTDTRIPHADYIFWWWNYLKEISISDTKMGCGRRCRQKTLGEWNGVSKQLYGFFLILLLPSFIEFQSKFTAFKNKYEKTFNSDHFDYDSLAKSDYVFMRWKEHFLVSFDSNVIIKWPNLMWTNFTVKLQVPDHTIKDINGASFAGFYYICFQKSKAEMEGYYYHRSSEW